MSIATSMPAVESVDDLGRCFPAHSSHNLLSDWLGGCLRQVEGPAVGHDLESLAGGIVDHLASLAMCEMTLELLADFDGGVAFQVVFELSHELVAGNH